MPVFIVSTPEGERGDLKYINKRNIILYKKYIHKAPPDDLDLSSASQHLQQQRYYYYYYYNKLNLCTPQNR